MTAPLSFLDPVEDVSTRLKRELKERFRALSSKPPAATKQPRPGSKSRPRTQPRSVPPMSSEVLNDVIDKAVDSTLVADARNRIAHSNAKAQVRFLESISCLSEAQVAEMESRIMRTALMPQLHWKAARLAFAVPYEGALHYPRFQFGEFSPCPVIGLLLAALPPGMSEWQTAFWFVSSNHWLDGRSPDQALTDPAAVLRAAQMEGKAIPG